MDLREAFEKAIIANELSDNLNAAYRFSDPDGIKTGKSGYSFGICQFDINNNESAGQCLRECGFNETEIELLKKQIVDIKPFNARLKSHATTVDHWDDKQLAGCLDHVLYVAADLGFRYADNFACVTAADYHNQIYMGTNGRLAGFCASLGRPVTAEDIYKFKLSLPWGRKRPDDVDRRYNNIADLFGEPRMHAGKPVAEED